MPLDKARQQQIDHMLNALEHAPNLTKWEEEFIASVSEQFATRGTLSDRQLEILTKIFEEA